jgi:hypothetical protein
MRPQRRLRQRACSTASSTGRRATSSWCSDAAGRAAGSVGRAGHRLHRVPGPGAAGGRGPGHLSADHRDACGAASKVVRGFSFFGASFVYVIFEDGTDIYWARSRVLEYLNSPAGKPAAGRGADARARCHRRGLGLPVRAAKHKTDLAELRADPGLVRALPADQGARRGRSRQRRRLRAQVPGHRRSAAAGFGIRSMQVKRGDPQEQPRRRRPRGRDGRDRIHGARPRLPARHRGHRANGAEAPRAARRC